MEEQLTQHQKQAISLIRMCSKIQYRPPDKKENENVYSIYKIDLYPTQCQVLMKFFTGLRRLEMGNIYFMRQIQAIDCVEMISTLPLQCLTISLIPSIKNQAVRIIARKMTTLEEFFIRSSQIDDQNVSVMAQSFPNLKSLNLHHNCVTFKSFQKFVNLKSLAALNLERNTLAFDTTIAFPLYQNIVQLNLSDQSKKRDEFYSFPTQRLLMFPNLKKLFIQTLRISYEYIYVSKLKNLEYLDISGNEIDQAGIVRLRLNLTRLTYFRYFNNNLTMKYRKVNGVFRPIEKNQFTVKRY